MFSFFRKDNSSTQKPIIKDNIDPGLQNTQAMPKETRIDLTSGNELSLEGKLFCATLTTQNLPEELNLTQSAEKVDPLKNEELQENMDLLRLITNYQKVELEEAALLGVKQYLSITRQELQNQLSKEIGRKIINIDTLRLEIDALENNCKELSEWSRHRSLIVENFIGDRKIRR